MVLLPDRASKTAALIFDRRIRDAEDWRRPHLGASLIGAECMRHLWYGFRWACKQRTPLRYLPGQMNRLLERGHREEAWIVEELRAAGVQVESVDPATGQQFLVKLGPHYGGSCDGKALGIPDAPKTWHLLEVKTHNLKSYEKLIDPVKGGVRKAKPEHNAQMQSYMLGLKLERAIYIAVCKDDDRIYTERVYFDRALAESLVHKASRVVQSSEPLAKIKEDPSWYQCKMCVHAAICHGEEFGKLERNCRTCASATPRSDGAWGCELFAKTLSVEEQRAGCPSHLFIPALLTWKPVEVDEANRTLVYERPDGVRVIDHGRELAVRP